MPILDLSRILDNVRLIEREKQRTCTTFRMKRGKITDTECGKPAHVEAIRTCCDNASSVSYWCADHVDLNTTHQLRCRHCGHVCTPGVCFHRILNTI